MFMIRPWVPERSEMENLKLWKIPINRLWRNISYHSLTSLTLFLRWFIKYTNSTTAHLSS